MTQGATPDIVCNLAANGETSSADMVAVALYGAGSRDYTFYGTDGAGNDFCCAFDESPDPIIILVIDGTALSDIISADDLFDPGSDYDLMVTINGKGGDDWIYGTDGYTQALYYGNAASDHIWSGNACWVEGGGGADFIFGSDSGDDLYGFGPNATGTDDVDEIHGYGADDVIVGGAEDDILNGNEGSDTIDGNSGLDVMCGGPDTDYFDGGDAADDIWGGAGTDYVTGGAGTDQCSAENHDCEGSLGSEPLECD